VKATLFLVQVFEGGDWVFDESHKTPLNHYKSQRYLQALRMMGRTARLIRLEGVGEVVE